MSGFIMMKRSEDTLELLKDPKAFALLALIAMRARRSDTISIHNLELNQAFVGDCKGCGLTPKEYRTAKDRLHKMGLVAFKGTSKGSIATLLSTILFDINCETEGEQKASKGPTGGEQKATNEDRKEKKELNPKDVDGRGNHSPKIKINEYGDIMNPDNPPITVACSVTGDYLNSAGAGFFNKANQAIGDRVFREAVAELWGELKTDTIRKPGAILTNKLKKLMEGAAK